MIALKAKIEGELQKISDRAIQLLGRSLVPHGTDTETTVVYQKMLADHHSYTAEITHGEAKSKATENAQLAYRDEGDQSKASLTV